MTDHKTTKKTFSRRLWIPGKPTKSKINAAIVKNVDKYQCCTWDANKVAREEDSWEPHEQDDTPGYFVTVVFTVEGPTQVLPINDRPHVSDSGYYVPEEVK